MTNNPRQSAYTFHKIYYPFDPMLYHCKTMSYPLAFASKAPTTTPTTTASTTKTVKTSQTTAISSTIVASNPQHSAYYLNPMYYVYRLVLSHRKPMPFGYPGAFPLILGQWAQGVDQP